MINDEAHPVVLAAWRFCGDERNLFIYLFTKNEYRVEMINGRIKNEGDDGKLWYWEPLDGLWLIKKR